MSAATCSLSLEELFEDERSWKLSQEGLEKIEALSGPKLGEFRSHLELKKRDMVRERRTGSAEAQRVDCAMRAVLFREKFLLQRATEIIRWKTVADEKPDADMTVLGFNELWGDRCWPCAYDGEEWTSVEGCCLDGRGKDPERQPPTHWAPWPAGPRMEGGAK